MATPPARLLIRVTRVVLVLNAALAAIAGLGFAFGFVPHASEHPLLARRAAAGELAGVFIFGFVAARLRRDPGLIVLPLVFVALQLAISVYDLAQSGSSKDAPPMVVEAMFFTVYAVCAARTRRPG